MACESLSGSQIFYQKQNYCAKPNNWSGKCGLTDVDVSTVNSTLQSSAEFSGMLLSKVQSWDRKVLIPNHMHIFQFSTDFFPLLVLWEIAGQPASLGKFAGVPQKLKLAPEK
jgi:hypothetical protein